MISNIKICVTMIEACVKEMKLTKRDITEDITEPKEQ